MFLIRHTLDFRNDYPQSYLKSIDATEFEEVTRMARKYKTLRDKITLHLLCLDKLCALKRGFYPKHEDQWLLRGTHAWDLAIH